MKSVMKTMMQDCFFFQSAYLPVSLSSHLCASSQLTCALFTNNCSTWLLFF